MKSVIQTVCWNQKKRFTSTENSRMNFQSQDELSVSTDSPLTPTESCPTFRARKAPRLAWVDHSTLVIGFTNSEVVQLVDVPLSTPSFMVDIRMASAIRMALLGRSEETQIFSNTKCLKHLLCNFGSFFQAQRKYENNFVNRTQDQLVHSKLMKILLVFATTFKLHHTVDGLEDWHWLSDYAHAMQAIALLYHHKEQDSYTYKGRFIVILVNSLYV